MRALLLATVLGVRALHGQVDQLEGLWQGYDGEWGHVSRQLVALAARGGRIVRKSEDLNKTKIRYSERRYDSA
jgi:hypothetical protein